MDKFFELIAGEHRANVFGLLYSLLRDRDLAEDLTQETFVVLFNKIGEIDVSQPILPWLLTTARNLAANAQRRRKLEQSIF
ncbi:MAG: sigma factor, partial [Rubripirellula sp.]|nr:sigma factor [Rubripirellula sp.]